jgi:hypothetical protein
VYLLQTLLNSSTPYCSLQGGLRGVQGCYLLGVTLGSPSWSVPAAAAAVFLPMLATPLYVSVHTAVTKWF